MKTIFLTGRVTADPEIKTVGDKDKKVANFTLANNDVNKEQAEYFDIVCWDKQAEFVEGYVKKGQKLAIQGSFQNEMYKDKDDNTRYHFRITALQIEFAC